MKKMFFLFALLCFGLSACLPAAFQPEAAASPAPSISDADIQATVAVQVEQTLQSLPTSTLAPSSTPVVITATSAPTQTAAPSTPTNTGTPTSLPSSTTAPGTGTVTLAVGTSGTLPFTATPNTGVGVTSTGTDHYQYYGTMPPDIAYGQIALSNMSKTDAYISLQCTTPEGYVTVIEYPVGGSVVGTRAPAGSYFYVAWVGGKQFTGSFKLRKSGDALIRMYKDRVEVK